MQPMSPQQIQAEGMRKLEQIMPGITTPPTRENRLILKLRFWIRELLGIQHNRDLIEGLRRDVSALEGVAQNQGVMLRMLEERLGLTRHYDGATALDYKLIKLREAAILRRKVVKANGQRGRSPSTARATRSQT